MFLHAEPLHLLFNAMTLWSVTSYLEGAIGKTKTATLYLALGLVSGLVSYLWHVSQYGYGNSVGASGAICGLIGVCIGFTLRHRNGAKHLVGHYAGWALWIGILAFSSWNIDNAAHIGGLVPGALVGLVVRRKGPASPLARRLWLTALLVGIAIVLASFVLCALTPLPPEYLDAVAG
jgi:rhomboid protease GluP